MWLDNQRWIKSLILWNFENGQGYNKHDAASNEINDKYCFLKRFETRTFSMKENH